MKYLLAIKLRGPKIKILILVTFYKIKIKIKYENMFRELNPSGTKEKKVEENC